MDKILIIGFGSLMSHHGIHSRISTRDIVIFDPFIVRFNGLRAFNTNESHYMDIGRNFNPIGVQVDLNEKIDDSGNTFECLAFFIKNEAVSKIGRREGYPTELLERINNLLKSYKQKEELTEKNQKIAKILWSFYPEKDNHLSNQEKIYNYREELGHDINYDIINAHSYVPHPIKILSKQIDMPIYGLISIHTDIGAKRENYDDIQLMTIQEAIRSKKPPRKSYFKECILGGVHGVNIRDLLSGMNSDDEKMKNYLINLKEDIDNEWNNTQDWEFHGDNLHTNLKRSGLLEYFPNL